MSVHYSEIKHERYADDIVVHCRSRSEAEEFLNKLKKHLFSLKLSVNEAKTKIVYSKQGRRKERYPEVSFTFLGHQFRPYKARTRTGEQFLSFGPQIGARAAKKIVLELRKMQLHRKTSTTLHGLAEELNPKLRGWINYYGKYGGRKFDYVLHLLNISLSKWVRWRYKLRGMAGKIIEKLKMFYNKSPNLFAHWQRGIRPLRVS